MYLRNLKKRVLKNECANYFINIMFLFTFIKNSVKTTQKHHDKLLEYNNLNNLIPCRSSKTISSILDYLVPS